MNKQKNTFLNQESGYSSSGCKSATKKLENTEQTHEFPGPHFSHMNVHSRDPFRSHLSGVSLYKKEQGAP